MKNHISNKPEFIFQYRCPHYNDDIETYTYPNGYCKDFKLLCDCNKDKCEYYRRDLPNEELCALVVDLKKNPDFKFSNYAISRKEKNMSSECDKRKLIGGRMVVKLRNGTKLMVFAEKAGLIFVDISDTGFGPCFLHCWDENLNWEGRNFDFEHNPDYDIVKMYKPANRYTIEDRLFFNDECGCNDKCNRNSPVIDYEWTWQRSERKPTEMTIAEIEKELGYPVKIIKERKCNYFQSQEQLVGVGDKISFDKGCCGR